MFIDYKSIIVDLQLIREKRPLIHNITNYVSMEWVANGLLSLGASPVMAHAREEVSDICRLSKALVINIGTLSEDWVGSMRQALETAFECGIPVVLDPVGAGASQYRTQVALDLLSEGGVKVLRGNASEICALAGEKPTTKGVDSALLPSEACEAAKKLHREFGCVVVASGSEDLIVGPEYQVRVYNGTSTMTRVTGMGCLVSAMVATFCSVQNDVTLAAANAMAYAGIVGEKASANSAGPGSFAMSYLDFLAKLKEEEIKKLLTVEYHESRF